MVQGLYYNLLALEMMNKTLILFILSVLSHVHDSYTVAIRSWLRIK